MLCYVISKNLQSQITYVQLNLFTCLRFSKKHRIIITLAGCSHCIVIKLRVIYKHVVVCCYFMKMLIDKSRDFLLHFLIYFRFERLNSDLFQQWQTIIIILYVRLDDVLLSTSVMQRTRKTKLSGILSVIHSERIAIKR